MLKPVMMAASIMLLASGAAAQVTTQLPRGTQITPQQTPRGGWRPTLPGRCVPDPAIVSVTLTKSAARGAVTVSYEVRNVGRSAWASSETPTSTQQNVSLIASNANTGAVFRDSRRLPIAAAAGARMLLFTSPVIPNAFDDTEWGGSLDVIIGYDPDIYLDSRPCNDDVNSANNRVHVDYAAILAFMTGPARTQTFTP
jgi:hypothetical protein